MKKKFKKLSLDCHPDKNDQSIKEQKTQEFQKLKEDKDMLLRNLPTLESERLLKKYGEKYKEYKESLKYYIEAKGLLEAKRKILNQFKDTKNEFERLIARYNEFCKHCDDYIKYCEDTIKFCDEIEKLKKDISSEELIFVRDYYIEKSRNVVEIKKQIVNEKQKCDLSLNDLNKNIAYTVKSIERDEKSLDVKEKKLHDMEELLRLKIKRYETIKKTLKISVYFTCAVSCFVMSIVSQTVLNQQIKNVLPTEIVTAIFAIATLGFVYLAISSLLSKSPETTQEEKEPKPVLAIEYPNKSESSGEKPEGSLIENIQEQPEEILMQKSSSKERLG